jgi:hypothetical protein
MGDEGTKNYLFFIGKNRFKEYFLNPFKSLLNDKLLLTNFYTVMEASAIFTLKMNCDISNKSFEITDRENRNLINLKLNRLNEYENYPVTINKNYLNFTSAFNLKREDTRINRIIYKNNPDPNTSKIPNKINIECYFIIMPPLKDIKQINDNLLKIYENKASVFHNWINNEKIKLSGIFLSDIKEYHIIAETFLSHAPFDIDHAKFVVLPCMHEIYEGARDGNYMINKKKAKYDQHVNFNERNTNCRKDQNDLDMDRVSIYSFLKQNRKNICDKIIVKNKNTRYEYEIDWKFYFDFYKGYRDQNKKGKKLCRENNFLRIFLDYLDDDSNFIVPVVNETVNENEIENVNNETDTNKDDNNEADNNEADNNEADNNEADNNEADNNETDTNEAHIVNGGGKKSRKSRKLRKSRKYRKHKSRKNKSRR